LPHLTSYEAHASKQDLVSNRADKAEHEACSATGRTLRGMIIASTTSANNGALKR